MIKGHKVNIDWVSYVSDIRKLYAKLSSCLDVYKSFNIISINRGGAIPATMISHMTNVPNNIYSIGIKTYNDDTNKKEISFDDFIVYQDISEIGIVNNKPVLIIDDLIDSGETMRYVYDKYCLSNERDIIIAAVYNKNNKFNAEVQKLDRNVEFVWSQQYAKNKWLVMPYEKD